MDDTTKIVIIVSVIVGLIFYYVSWRREQQRKEALQSWAQSNNWSYFQDKDRQIYERYSFLNRLRRGSNRYAFDILEGRWEEYPAKAFNFHYETYRQKTDSDGESSKTTQHHYIGIVLIQMESNFPQLTICPENFLDKFSNALGLSDINFESIEFSRKFNVNSEDKKFAYDFCNTSMMNYLLQVPDIELEVERNIIAIYNEQGKMDAATIQRCLDVLCQLRQLMPKYLFKN